MKVESEKLYSRIIILEKIDKILYSSFDNPNDLSLNEQVNLLSDYGLDSVAILMLILRIEKEFNITIKDYELDAKLFTKMANLIDIIESKINEDK